MTASDWMDPWDHEPIKPVPAYKGKAGYGKGKPWHDRVRTWTSRDGKVTPLRKLKDSHLENIMHYLHRKAEHWMMGEMVDLLGAQRVLQGEMALECVESELSRLTETTPKEWLRRFPIYEALCREADRRAAEQGLVSMEDWPEPRMPRRPLVVIDDEAALYDGGWGDGGPCDDGPDNDGFGN